MKIAVIGAGIAGISAAKTFFQAGHQPVLFEKSRELGGRCATKRWEGHIIDHGAQYFILRDTSFREEISRALGEDSLRIAAPIIDEQGREIPDPGRYFAKNGMSSLVRSLAGGLEIRLESTVSDALTLLKPHGGDFDHVISTAPWPQTARLFALQADDGHPTMAPCLTAVFAFATDWNGKCRDIYAISDAKGPLAWSACENHKPGRILDGVTVLIAQMSEEFSLRHLERDPASLPEIILPIVSERWEIPPKTQMKAFGHRWRFARVKRPLRRASLPPRCSYAGDGLVTSRIEEVWLAGKCAAEMVVAEHEGTICLHPDPTPL